METVVLPSLSDIDRALDVELAMLILARRVRRCQDEALAAEWLIIDNLLDMRLAAS